MSLQPTEIGPVPALTATVARAEMPHGNRYVAMRDTLGTLFTDQDFVDLFSSRGQPAYPPWRLALVTVLQFAEGLSDRQAADAVRARLDWKYALGLELTDPGFDFSLLSAFRSRLRAGTAEDRRFATLLAGLHDRGFLKARGQQRTDSTYVLAAIRTLNRLECIGERYARRSTASPRRRRLGSRSTSTRSGPNVIRNGCRSIGCPRARPTGSATRRGSALMGLRRSARCTHPARHPSCTRFRRSISCGACGSSNSPRRARRRAGAPTPSSRPPPC